MCGICGGNYPLEIVQKASQTMRQRGPDYSGSFSDERVAFAHNRLSIIDLECEANQPFTSPFCPHLVLVFNGEIYNYLEIKAELEALGIPFYTTSDTEVLLHAFAYWQEDCVSKFNGDFAFVIYDKRDSMLFLARDRLGNKPLFYELRGEKLFFASEIKAFLTLDSYEFDLEEVGKWLLFSNGDAQKTIYQGILNFPPAHFAHFQLGENHLRFHKYWNFTPDFEEIERLEGGEKKLQESLEELESLLLNATKLRLRADVPVALSVSGGIDSSILAHLAHKLGGDCQYFGVNFKDSSQDESAHMAQLQRDLNLKIHFVSAPLEDINEDFKKLVWHQDEIFRSFSIYMQYLLFQTLSSHCKVVIGGQGADELFGGYYHHVGRYLFCYAEALQERVNIYGNSALQEYMFGLKCSLPTELKLKLFAEDNAKNLRKLAKNSFVIPSLENLLGRFVLNFTQGLWLDCVEFNLPNLLRYEDRSAMRFSIENRTPFTDYRVVEFAFRIPPAFKFQKGFSKYILRLLLEKMGSKELAWRVDKIGFGAPECALMQKLGYNYDSIFDVRCLIFEILRDRV